jgi:uncharacterized integral membrane protein (TIGR00698 family)
LISVVEWNNRNNLILRSLAMHHGAGKFLPIKAATMTLANLYSCRRHSRLARLKPGGIWPGLGLAVTIALLALPVPQLLGLAGLSPLIVAMLLGMAFRNAVGPMPMASPGIAFSLRRVLRCAIVLLGFQLTLSQVADVGGQGIVVIVCTLIGTLLFTKAAGRVLGVERRLTELIAAGTAICGASAVIACNTVTRGADEDVAYAVACVTVFGSLSMAIFPLLAGPLGLAPGVYGLWVGSSVHEVAQAVGAAFAQGGVAGQMGTVAKLSRVILLAPVILTLGAFAMRRAGEAGAKPPTPWFVFGFIAVMLVNSVVQVPAEWHGRVVAATAFLLAVALAAMGLETDVRKLRVKGLRPLALGAAAWLFVSTLSLTLIHLVGIAWAY